MSKLLRMLEGLPDRWTIGHLRQVILAHTESGVCRRCDQPITRIQDSRWWTHADGIRGCRAASFTDALGWDDSIPRTWTASPKESM